jgi:branched-chain amino acid transport system permease protein
VTTRREVGLGLALLAALAAVPLLVQREDVLNFLFLVLLSVTLAQSWNIIAGYAGQVNLGHAAFFGLGALVTRTLWIAGTPVLLAMVAGAAVAVAFALLIGAAAFRLRGAYFAIGTLALGEILRITVGNVLAEISTLPTATIGSYRLAHRYVLALGLAALAMAAVAALGRSRLGLGMQAIREDEEAAEASGVGALSLKLLALVISTALVGLAGGLFAYYHISYYPAHPFGPHWTFDAVLVTFIGGVGTLYGPLLGAAFYVFLKEYLAIRWVDFHLLIFGALFVAIVLLLPGGLVEGAARARALVRRPAAAPTR